MSHLDPDQLTLLALGEPVASADDSAHLATCDACTAELADLRLTATVARSTMDDAGLEAPPDRVWERVSAELGLGGPTRSAGERESAVMDAAPAAPPAASGPRDIAPTAPASPDSAHAAPTSPDPAPRRRRSGAIWALAASLVLIAAVGVGAWVVTSSLTPTVVAAADLEPFPDHPGASGVADVEVARDGSRTLTVTLDGGDAGDGYREVWLIRNDAAALISLGVLEGADGTFVIPENVDLDEYSIVDISVEPVDGDPAHSGDSIVRGQLS